MTFYNVFTPTEKNVLNYKKTLSYSNLIQFFEQFACKGERDKKDYFLTFLQTNAKSDGVYFYQTILDLHGLSMWILLNKLNKTITLTKPPNQFEAGC